MSDLFKYEKNDLGIVTITLTRPEVHNAFNDELIEQLTAKALEMKNDSSIRLMVLTGEGKSFCAGADLNWMKKMKDYTSEENFKDSVALHGLFDSLNNLPFPVIGKVNGAALGGGAGLIAVCDYVIACKSAKIGFTESLLGLVPAVISPFVVAKIGQSNARAYFMSGEIFMAQKAQEIGLVHQVVPLDDLESAFEKVIEKFLKAGPSAAREAKQLIKGIFEHAGNSEDVKNFTCKTISRVRISDEAQEGMNALLEKRKASWLV